VKGALLLTLPLCACTSAEVGEAVRYVLPNYVEAAVAREHERPNDLDTDIVELRAGWYVQAVPTRPSGALDRSGRAPPPVQVFSPEMQKMLDALIDSSKATKAAADQTITDQFGEREGYIAGITLLLAALAAILKHFAPIKGPKETDE